MQLRDTRAFPFPKKSNFWHADQVESSFKVQAPFQLRGDALWGRLPNRS